MADDAGHEGGVFMDGLTAFIKRDLNEACAHLSLCEEGRGSPLEDTMRSQQSATQRRVLSRTEPSWHPDLRLSASRTVRNKFLSFVCQAICSALLQLPQMAEVLSVCNWYPDLIQDVC